MYKLLIVIPLVSLVLCLAQVADCGTVEPQFGWSIDNASAYWDVVGTGLNRDLVSDPAYYSLSGSESGVDEILPTTYSVTSYAGSPENVVEIFSEASFSVSNGKIGVFAQAQAVAGWPYSPGGFAEAAGAWQDRIGLFYSGEGETPDLPYSNLIFNMKLDGSLKTSLIEGETNVIWKTSNASMTAYFGSNLASQTVSGNEQYEASGNDLILSGTLPLNSSRQASISYYLSVYAQSTYGSTIADFSHTLEIASILFPDGTTPESHGWEIAFESGMQSPNIAPPTAVPEPSTFALLGIGGLALAVCGWWRRTRHRLGEAGICRISAGTAVLFQQRSMGHHKMRLAKVPIITVAALAVLTVSRPAAAGHI